MVCVQCTEEADSWDKFNATVKKRKSLGDLKRMYWAPEWIPQVELTNAVNIHAKEESGKKYRIRDIYNSPSLDSSWNEQEVEGFSDLLDMNPRKGRWIRCKYEYDVTFAEELELENFPFDVCLSNVSVYVCLPMSVCCSYLCLFHALCGCGAFLGILCMLVCLCACVVSGLHDLFQGR